MSSAIEIHDVVIAQIFNEIECLRVFSEEVLSGVRATVELTVLKLAIADFVHTLEQHPRLIALKEWVPSTPPDHFDDVPAGTTEHALEFLNDFTVAANRTIKTLKVTVHHKVKVP